MSNSIVWKYIFTNITICYGTVLQQLNLSFEGRKMREGLKIKARSIVLKL